MGEDALLARQLGLWLTIDDDFDINLSLETTKKTPRPAVAVERVDGAIGRLGKRFEWGDFDEATYRAELGR